MCEFSLFCVNSHLFGTILYFTSQLLLFQLFAKFLKKPSEQFVTFQDENPETELKTKLKLNVYQD